MPNVTGHLYQDTAPTGADDCWHCPQCGWESASKMAVWGHIGRKHKKEGAPFQHGTPAGYQKHMRRKEVSCPACKAAWNRYYRKYRARVAGKPPKPEVYV